MLNVPYYLIHQNFKADSEAPDKWAKTVISPWPHKGNQRMGTREVRENMGSVSQR